MLSPSKENIRNHTNPIILVKPRIYKPPKILWNNFKTENKNKHQHKTMGVANVHLPQPHEFLRKKFTLSFGNCPTKITRDCCNEEERKPPVPTAVVSQTQTEKCKDFPRENVKFISKLAPPEVQPKIVVTHRGHKQDLERSGLEPRYIYKADLGRVPQYIQDYGNDNCALRENAKREQEKRQYDLEQEEKRRREEFDKHLSELKSLWLQKTKEFLLLPVVTDILARIRRRHNLEKELAAIEAEIEKLEG